MGLLDLIKVREDKVEVKEDYLHIQLEAIKVLCDKISAKRSEFKNIAYINEFRRDTLHPVSCTVFYTFTVEDEKDVYNVDVDVNSCDADLGIKVNKIPVCASINKHIEGHKMFSIRYKNDSVEVYPLLGANNLDKVEIRNTLTVIRYLLNNTLNYLDHAEEIHKAELYKLRYEPIDK